MEILFEKEIGKISICQKNIKENRSRERTLVDP